MLEFFNKLLNRKKLNYPALMDREALIIDVRTPQEFAQGSFDQSINIPLNEIMNRIEEIRQPNKPIIVCCRSGARAENATVFLNKSGVEAYNAGSWSGVQAALAS